MKKRRRSDEDFADEIGAHLANETDQLIADGLSPEEARNAALRHFGSVTRTRERFYEWRRIMLWEQFAYDLRYAWRSLAHSRAFVTNTVVTLLSAVALAFSISGLYGVLAYTFGQRKQEIGIRMALGASTSAVERMVFAQSANLASAGTVLGLIAGFAIMKLLSGFVRLTNVSVVDPLAFAVSVAMIGAAVALAAFWPARRAGRLDPSAMLRADA